MKVLHVTASDSTGAGKAAIRLHRALLKLDVSSQLLVQQSAAHGNLVVGSEGPLGKIWAKIRGKLDDAPRRFYPKRGSAWWSPAWLPSSLADRITALRPDVVNLHWINGGMLSLGDLAKLQMPIVWTMHDMWPFTGGCHYPGDCRGYQATCGACPQLGSTKQHDLSRWVHSRKQRGYPSLNLTLLSPSRWLADEGKTSSLLEGREVLAVANGVDLSFYKPFDKAIARELLGLPKDRRLILVGAMSLETDARKGLPQFREALLALSQHSSAADGYDIVTFGSKKPLRERLGIDGKFGCHDLGVLSDEVAMRLAYCACDVFVAPSLEDNLPNTAVEATACGRPTVAFSIGGMPEIVDHELNGYLAGALDSADLAKGIAWCLEDATRLEMLSYNARKKAEAEFDGVLQAKRYLAVYERVSSDAAA